MKNIESVLKQLDNINDALAVECPIVSTKTTVKFKPLSVEQQKQLIKNATGLALDSIKISNIINKIIIDNAAAAHDLNVVDKEGILLAIKMQGSNVQDKQCEQTLAALRSLDICKLLQKTIEQHNIVVNLKSPSIQRDSAINSEFIQLFQDKQLSNTDIISQYYVYDVVKYIESFELNGETIKFDECSNAKDYVAIATHMPASIIGAVTDFANEVKEAVNKVFREHNVPLQTAAF